MKFIKQLLHSYLDGEVFTAFDTETTGLSSKYEKIIEIGAVKFDKNGIIEVDDCVVVSKLIDPLLDEADLIADNYILDVCSK